MAERHRRKPANRIAASGPANSVTRSCGPSRWRRVRSNGRSPSAAGTGRPTTHSDAASVGRRHADPDTVPRSDEPDRPEEGSAGTAQDAEDRGTGGFFGRRKGAHNSVQHCTWSRPAPSRSDIAALREGDLRSGVSAVCKRERACSTWRCVLRVAFFNGSHRMRPQKSGSARA